MNVHNTGERPYQCKLCPKAFATSQNLKVHKAVHMRVKPYECDLCGQTFKYHSSMKNHSRKWCLSQRQCSSVVTTVPAPVNLD
ncbi:PREDICTED: putative zinc finger protein 833 [Vollenhovia emeryi]|uniref:putative zinc finger protein 833 n=1 Tax=Vollenhovia emeryi TaxID=411798 RepID=UPI0005F51F58|nr:PREDICTED: putative zinc finger protein 833 [Vollenhovia emeryi]